MSLNGPFSGDTPDSIPLANAPLALVLAQVRFPRVSMVSHEDFFAPFQDALRDAYPHTDVDTEVLIVPNVGEEKITGSRVWRLRDTERQWCVTLSPDFVALETSQYGGASDYFSRLAEVLTATEKHIRPAQADRLGVRYVAKDACSSKARLREFLRPEMLGILGTSHGDQPVNLMLTQASATLDEAVLNARWGWLPTDTTHDPALAPLATESWVLDVDVASDRPLAFESQRIAERAHGFSRVQYRFFRWAVTETFLISYSSHEKPDDSR